MEHNHARYDYNPAAVAGQWTLWLIALTGIWQIFAPWIWGYSWREAAVWSAVITGIVITVGALISAVSMTSWPGWWSIVLGVWLIISPFALGYAFIPRAQANDIVVGVIIVVLGIIAAVSQPIGYGGGSEE